VKLESFQPAGYLRIKVMGKEYLPSPVKVVDYRLTAEDPVLGDSIWIGVSFLILTPPNWNSARFSFVATTSAIRSRVVTDVLVSRAAR
jgi:hypothetical protein